MDPKDIALHDAINFLSRTEYTLLQMTEQVIELKAKLERALEG